MFDHFIHVPRWHLPYINWRFLESRYGKVFLARDCNCARVMEAKYGEEAWFAINHIPRYPICNLLLSEHTWTEYRFHSRSLNLYVYISGASNNGLHIASCTMHFCMNDIYIEVLDLPHFIRTRWFVIFLLFPSQCSFKLAFCTFYCATSVQRPT